MEIQEEIVSVQPDQQQEKNNFLEIAGDLEGKLRMFENKKQLSLKY